MLYLYKLTQNVLTTNCYDSCVVCASSMEEAIIMNPQKILNEPIGFDAWVNPAKVSIQYLGEAHHFIGKGVIVASYLDM